MIDPVTEMTEILCSPLYTPMPRWNCNEVVEEKSLSEVGADIYSEKDFRPYQRYIARNANA